MNKQILLTLLLLPFVGGMQALAVPHAPVITYGLVRDEYGIPLTKDARANVDLVADGGEFIYCRSTVDKAAIPGMNYRLSLEIDSQGPQRAYAVTVGTPMRVKVAVGGVNQSIAPTPTFVTPAAGTAQRLDWSIGTDADGDGIPDTWETWQMARNPNAGITTIADFTPNGDFDHDGMSNFNEYLAGTDPFLPTDLLKILSITKVPDTQLVAIRFATSDARTYHVLMTDNLANAWAPVQSTRNLDAAPVYQTYTGTGRVFTVYVDASMSSSFFRVAVN